LFNLTFANNLADTAYDTGQEQGYEDAFDNLCADKEWQQQLL
jgi:hypothetical protein